MASKRLNETLSKLRKPSSLANAVVIFGLAMPVLLGWTLNPSVDSGFFESWVPMHFYTAISFALIGLAILFRNAGAPNGARALGAVVFLIGSKTLAEYGFTDHSNLVVYSISQMSLNSALSITACGLGLALLSDQQGCGKRLVFSGILGALAAGLGFIKLASLVLEPAVSIDQGYLLNMALPTALGVLFGGTHLVASALRRLSDDYEEAYRIFPLVITTGLLFGTLGLWQIFFNEDLDHLRKIVDIETRTVKSEITARLDGTTFAIKQSASRLEALGSIDHKVLELDAKASIDHFRIIKHIGVIGPDYRVRWSIPAETGDVFDEGIAPLWKAALDDALSTHEPSLSHTIPLRTGGNGFLLPAAMIKNGKPRGFLYATVSASKLFENLPGTTDFQITLRESRTPIYSNGRNLPFDPLIESRIQLKWRLARLEGSITPTPEFISQNRNPIATGILFGGTVFSLLIGLFLQSLALTRRNERRHQEVDQLFTSRQNIALTSTQIAVWSEDLRTGRFWRSENHHELFGHRAALNHWGTETLLTQVLPVDRDRIAAELAKPVASDEATLLEFRIRRETDGEIRWLKLISRTDLDREGNPYQVVGIVQDITRERLELAEKKRVEAEVRLAYERLERVIEATGQGIWERNLSDPHIHFMDAQCRHIFGFKADESPSYATVLSLIYSEDITKIEEAIREHITQKTPRFKVDFRILPRVTGGTMVWARVKGLVHEVNGVPDRLVATVNDITARVEDRRQLEAALERAEVGVEAKSAFLANISHEIRTPLNGIIGMADLIHETHLDSEQEKYVKIIQQSGATLLTLLNDILDLSKIDAGKLQLDSAEFSPDTVVENQVEILFAKAAEKKLSLGTFISPDLPSGLLGDPGRIGQIILNFVGNAIKFTSSGGIAVRVTDLKNHRTPDSIRFRIEVEDTGIGLSAADQAKLFQPFTQANHSTTNHYGGTGLGLSICKRLIEAMDGQIGVESSPGQGSTFWCEFPLKISNPLLLRQSRDGIEDLANKRALVVDEDPITRDIVHRYINSWGMRNGSVATVDEAISILRSAFDISSPYQMVVIGYSGESAKGLAVGMAIAKAFGPDCPKLILTSEFGMRIDPNAPGRELFAQFLTRPIKQSDLFEAFVNSLPGPKLLDGAYPRSDRSTITRPIGPVGRILVADDVTANQVLTLKLLEGLGHKAASAANGKEVLAAISQIEYDLILMDCQMPEMDGFEATRQIRTLENHTGDHIPIVALTANAMSGDDKKCLAAGMDDYLAKPIKKDKLDAMLRKWLGKKERRTSRGVA